MENQPFYARDELMGIVESSEDAGLGIAVDMWDQIRGTGIYKAGYSLDDVNRLRIRLEKAGINPERIGSYKD